jgi:hypothetical protein
MPGRPTAIFGNMPPHVVPGTHVPDGGNELFVDGSSRWVSFNQMYYLTTWKTALPNSREAFFYQDSSDFDPALAAQLPQLASSFYK